MLGHSEGKDSNGVRVTHELDAVGGTYDNAPHVYPNVVEKEYQKLEPFLNIYSSNITRPHDTLNPVYGKLARLLEAYPDKAAKFEKFLRDINF
jgi:hypothetical protein